MSSMSTCGSVAASIRPAGSASRRSSSRTAPPSSPSRRTEGTHLLRRLEIAGNTYIGVFCAANDELLIVAPDVPKSATRHIVGALETSPIVTSVGHSTVVGSLLALNSKGILASPFIEEAELDAIGDAVYPLPHRLSAVGNNVLCNDYGAVVHPGYDDEAVTFIGEVLGVNVVRGTVAGIKTVGSVAVATNIGVKTGLQAPLIGRDQNLAAATKLGLADPEDSDVNALLSAVSIYDGLLKENTDAEVATICGDVRVGAVSDLVLTKQLDQVLEQLRPDRVFLVSDGAEDEAFSPLIGSRIRADHVSRVSVRQTPTAESSYSTIGRQLKNPRVRRKIV